MIKLLIRRRAGQGCLTVKGLQDDLTVVQRQGLHGRVIRNKLSRLHFGSNSHILEMFKEAFLSEMSKHMFDFEKSE